MEPTTWPPVSTLTRAAGPGWTGLWSLLFTTERAIEALVQTTSFSEALDLISLGEELRAAGDDVAERHPRTVASATAADLGPVASAAEIPNARATIATLLSAVIAQSDDLLTRAPSADDALWLSGLTASLFAARANLNGTGA